MSNYEDAGTAFDPGAIGHEMVGRAKKPMTPLARAADAVENHLGVNDEINATPEAIARAVLQAIREPSIDMLSAGVRRNPLDAPVILDAWQAMIDAALEEG